MIICIVIAVLITALGFGCIIVEARDGFCEAVEVGFVALLVIAFIDFCLLFPFVVLDKRSGTTIGTITSVDKNFWGSTAIYIKTSETEQEKYCAEDEEVIKFAKENIGKQVKISYGTRVGFYTLDKCDQAPIDTMTTIEDE